ncbi:MAG: squalene synthase HpnC, partial [Methylocystis sp.]
LIDDARLAMEVGAIQTLAEHLVARLTVSDPLGDKVHEGKFGFALKGAMGAVGALLRRISRPRRAVSGAVARTRQ